MAFTRTKEKTKAVVHKLHRAKPHLDYIAALLTIPVLITAIIINVTNLNKSSHTPTPTPASSGVYGNTSIQTIKVSSTPQPTDKPDCIPGIGSISIDSPQTGATVSDNPICINISYLSQNHCGIVWAYRINNGPLSDYSNNSVCLYNVPPGQVTFSLNVKSLVNTDTKSVSVSFQNAPLVTPTPTSIPTPTKSVLTPAPTPGS